MENVYVIDLKEGNIISLNKKTDDYFIIEKKHSPIKKARGNANISLELRNLKTNAKMPFNTGTNTKVKKLYITDQEVQYLSRNKESITVLQLDSGETLDIPIDYLGKKHELLSDKVTNIILKMHQDEIISVSLPKMISIIVLETEPYIKKQTAAASYKKALISTNIKINVPQFILTGDTIKINTEDLSYVERVKK